MNSASRSLYRAGLLVALAAAVFTFGCGKKTVAPTPKTTPTPPPAATPTVTLQASPTSVNKGESAGGSASATANVAVNAPPVVEPPKGPTDEERWKAGVFDAYFDYDKADLRPDARAALSKTADFLKSNPGIKVTVEGHCDERGSTEYNLGLGVRRADSVKQYIVSLGVSADRVNTTSFGKEKPFCTESNEACWQQNRRGHFVKAN